MGKDGPEGLGKSGNSKAAWEGLLYLEVKLPTMSNRFLNFSLQFYQFGHFPTSGMSYVHT